MSNSKTHDTVLEGLRVRLNKTVEDERGMLVELSPGGAAKDPFLQKGIGNIIAVQAAKRGVPRGGHYHMEAHENSWTIQGTGFWYFYDFNEHSKTYKKSTALLTGLKSAQTPKGIEVENYTRENTGQIAQIFTSPYIYHLVIPIETPLIFFETSSRAYDEKDYTRIKPEEIQDPLLEKLLKRLTFDV